MMIEDTQERHLGHTLSIRMDGSWKCLDCGRGGWCLASAFCNLDEDDKLRVVEQCSEVSP